MHIPTQGQNVRVVPLSESVRQSPSGNNRALTEQPVEAVDRSKSASAESDNVHVSRQASRYHAELQAVEDKSPRGDSVADTNAAFSMAVLTRAQVLQTGGGAGRAHAGVQRQQVLGLLS